MGAGLRRANAAARASRLEGAAALVNGAVTRDWSAQNDIGMRLPPDVRPQLETVLRDLLAQGLVETRGDDDDASWRRYSGGR